MGAHHATLSSTNERNPEGLPETLESHPTLSQYTVDQRLFPGSGRMMRTYQVRSKPPTEATAVMKAMWLAHDQNVEDQIAELERIKEQLQDEPHVAPFLYWADHKRKNGDTYGTGNYRFFRPVYLLRPHVYTTLSDRLASRPFYTQVEKLWIVYQILNALQAMHSKGVCHGFLTTENIGLTSWNWVVILDIASYKARTALPDDDPSEYLYYFQELYKHHSAGSATNNDSGSTATTTTTTTTTSVNREKRCYIAPERFVSRGSNVSATTGEAGNKLTPAMDMFSAGCVLMETFLNGERALDLGDLMEYRTKGVMLPALQQKLNKIESSSLRAACRHMLHLDPLQRLSPKAYLERLQASDTIPAIFDHTIQPVLLQATTKARSPDARLAYAAFHYGDVLWETVGVRDRSGTEYFRQLLGGTVVQQWDPKVEQSENEKRGETFGTKTDAPTHTGLDHSLLLSETEALLKKLESLNLDEDVDDDDLPVTNSTGAPTESESKANEEETPEKMVRSSICKDCLLLYIQLVLANMRQVQRPTSKLVALQLLRRLGTYSDDEARLQRIVPVTVSLLQDQDVLVKAFAVQVLAETLSKVQSFPPSDSKVFPQYIFKRVAHLITDPSLVVRLAFAQSIPQLAETAHRFLDISFAVRLYEAVGGGGGMGSVPSSEARESVRKQDHGSRAGPSTGYSDSSMFGDDVAKLLDKGTATQRVKPVVKSPVSPHGASAVHSTPESAAIAAGKTLISSTYHAELASLRETVSRWVVHITTDQSEHSSPTKRVLLSNLPRLCTFFGLDGIMAFILPQILAFLNDRKDFQLRAALFQYLPSVCHIIGRAATEHFVLPCLETGLVDSEEQVVASSLFCLAELIELQLLSRSVLIGSTSKATIDTMGDTSLLRKYGALLVHPACGVRFAAMKTVIAASKLLGSPDSEVYISHVLRPYLRFQPSLRHLIAAEEMERCLYPSWTREKFEKELSNFVSASHVAGPWTSIGYDVRDLGGQQDKSKKKEEAQVKNTSYVPENQVENVREYLRMLARSRRGKYANIENDMPNLIFTDTIEGSLKLAQSIKVPRQDTMRSSQPTLPSWYDALRKKLQESDSGMSEHSAIRSVSALGQIYGLSIMSAGGTTEQTEGNNKDIDISEEEMQKMVFSDESRLIEAARVGEWGAETSLDPSLQDTSLLITKLKALQVPPLPPSLGNLRHDTTESRMPIPRNPAKESGTGTAEWKPRIDTLLATTSPITGHTAPVVRVAVSLDQSFFVSGSYDGTCRVWEMAQIESTGVLESSCTYSGHMTSSHNNVRVNDIAMVEGSSSVVSGASNGSLHVWRVDLVSSVKLPANSQNEVRSSQDRTRVVGTSKIRELNPAEGEILAVSHFNSAASSTITFASQNGGVHSWDLRCSNEPFHLKHSPDLGYLTSMSLGSDRNTILTGTSRGFLALWDLRFQELVKLWHHSRSLPILRLATSFIPPPQSWKGASGFSMTEARPFVFVSSGSNECAMFDVTSGSCRECFRTVPMRADGSDSNHFEDIPVLKEVPISSGNNLMSAGFLKDSDIRVLPPVTPIHAMVGSIGANDQSYLITGGGDHRIRFWDFVSPENCQVVSGQSMQHPRPSYQRIDLDGPCRLMLCRQPPFTGSRNGGRLPNGMGHGLSKPENHHSDAILDLKLGNNALISASRDCTVKVWR